jgi:hypothetical protein
MWTFDSDPTGTPLIANVAAAWTIVGVIFVLLVLA